MCVRAVGGVLLLQELDPSHLTRDEMFATMPPKNLSVCELCEHVSVPIDRALAR